MLVDLPIKPCGAFVDEGDIAKMISSASGDVSSRRMSDGGFTCSIALSAGSSHRIVAEHPAKWLTSCSQHLLVYL